MTKFNNFLTKTLLNCIKLYGDIKTKYYRHRLGECKFYPCCSSYAKQALCKYGPYKGTFLAIKRILRCNPFSKGGYDPLK